MSTDATRDITGLLAAWSDGDGGALNELLALVYPEVRRIARQHLNRCSGHPSVESAALANEAFLKLVRAGGIRCESRIHFLALCAQVVRRILTDHARQRRYAKRGGGSIQVAFQEGLVGSEPRFVDTLALDEALHSLCKIDWRKARVVELRYFGGLSTEETAAVLGISPETAKRDWRMAKAWLQRELTRSGPLPCPEQ